MIEEIVGEIEDEFDAVASEDFVPDGENYRVDGLFPLHELRAKLDLHDLESGDVDTIGGYVIQELGRFPRVGDSIDLGADYTIRVTTVQQKRVGQVLIMPRTQKAMRADGPGEA